MTHHVTGLSNSYPISLGPVMGSNHEAEKELEQMISYHLILRPTHCRDLFDFLSSHSAPRWIPSGDDIPSPEDMERETLWDAEMIDILASHLDCEGSRDIKIAEPLFDHISRRVHCPRPDLRKPAEINYLQHAFIDAYVYGRSIPWTLHPCSTDMADDHERVEYDYGSDNDCDYSCDETDNEN